MSIWPRWTGAALLLAAGTAMAQPFPGIGRPATPQEIQAWDIDVRPDFKGLPPGSGSVARGQQVWEAQCASCHGVFGENNEVFTPLVGGTTAQDVRSGRVARLTDESFPGRTTLMKLPTVSTLWDYIRRAMPWNAPKSLSNDDVYAVTAYMLHLGEVLPADFVMSDRNIAQVQARLPNRYGMTTDHGLWPGRGLGNGGRPDVRAAACMRNCGPAPEIASSLPEHARNAHGNLAEQQRLVGAQRGMNTAGPAVVMVAAAAPAATAAPPALLARHNCTACHGMDKAVVGPGFAQIAQKYGNRGDREAHLLERIVAGGVGVWGTIPMPAQALPVEDAKRIAAWLAGGAPK
jgi:S-disulfanyl-L-cysteine oxidoreductase SoxD